MVKLIMLQLFLDKDRRIIDVVMGAVGLALVDVLVVVVMDVLAHA